MAKKKFYAVVCGRKTGIFTDTNQARSQTTGFKGGRLFGFTTKDKAEQCLKDYKIPITHHETSTKKRFYAVVTGKKTGIYSDLQEAQAQTKGVKNSKYIGFATQALAEIYLAEHTKPAKIKKVVAKPPTVVKPKVIEPVSAPITMPRPQAIHTFYVDGAFFHSNLAGFYGLVTNDYVIKDFGAVPPQYLELHNYGAELYACKRALELALTYDIPVPQIYTDFEGVLHLLTTYPQKQNLKPAEEDFITFYKMISLYLNVTIEHISKTTETHYHKHAHYLGQKGRLLEN